MSGWRRALATAVLVGLAHGCAAPLPAGPLAAEPGTGLAFGAFDFSASDINATHVVLLRISPTKVYMGGSGERSTVTFSNGEFYAPNLSPGLYAVNGLYSRDLRIALDGNLSGNTFQVTAGGVAYAGTYRVTYQDRKGLLKRGDGAFERADSKASETQLLRWLSAELAGSAWADRIRARRAEQERGQRP